MLCEKCGKQEATYHSTVNINGNVTQTHLCSSCAIGENKVNQMFNVGNFLKPSFFNLEDPILETKPKTNKHVCNFCGKTLEDFLQSGLLGCYQCYKNFKSELLPIIKTMQIDVKHVGKTPTTTLEQLDGNEKTIKNLEFKLKQAVANENYELASELKKQINELKAEGN